MNRAWRRRVLLAAALTLALPAAAAAQPGTYYVSTAGCDTCGWSGTVPDPTGNDGPFATIDHARQVVNGTNGDTVYVRGGVYVTTSPIVFGANDSGTSGSP